MGSAQYNGQTIDLVQAGRIDSAGGGSIMVQPLIIQPGAPMPSTPEVTETPPFDQRAFRSALGSFPTGVAIITTVGADGKPVGLTCNSFSSVSLDPPLVSWGLRLASKSLDAFRQAGTFATNILAEDQQELSA